MSVTVRELVDSALEARAAIGRPALRRWRGSLLGSCLRMQFYAADRVPETNVSDTDGLLTMARGNFVAEFLTRQIAADREHVLFCVPDGGREPWAELPNDDFAANIDALVWWRGNPEIGWRPPTVYEFKTTTKYGMRYTPKAEHAVQAAAGRMAIEAAAGRDFESRLVYIDRSSDKWDMKEHLIGREWDDVVLRVLGALRYFDSRHRMPPRLRRDFDAKGIPKYPCGWCRWLDLCRPTGKER